jgi:hypothetical protein
MQRLRVGPCYATTRIMPIPANLALAPPNARTGNARLLAKPLNLTRLITAAHQMAPAR